MDDHEDSSSHTDSSLSSDTEGEQQNDEDASTAGEQGVKAKSKQLSYYYRTTEDRKKRKYTPFANQEKPSKQLRSYHAKKERTGGVITNKQKGDDILTADIDINEEENIDTDDEYGKVMSDSGSESEELNSTTSSRDLSASTYLSSDSMSESEDTDEDEQEQANEQRTDETCSNEEEEPLYKGSKISKVLSFVLIVSFVLKHNLSNSAWADLLHLLTALLGEWCKKSLQSV